MEVVKLFGCLSFEDIYKTTGREVLERYENTSVPFPRYIVGAFFEISNT